MYSTDRKKAPFHWFLQEMPAATSTGPGWTQDFGIPVSLPWRWQEPKYSSNHLCLPELALAGHHNWEENHDLNCILTARLNTHPKRFIQRPTASILLDVKETPYPGLLHGGPNFFQVTDNEIKWVNPLPSPSRLQ